MIGTCFEPWRAHGDDWIEAGDNILLARIVGVFADADTAKRIRRRIIACVNACAGSPTEALEAGALGRALDLMEAGFVVADGTCGGNDTSEDCPGCQAVALLRALGRIP